MILWCYCCSVLQENYPHFSEVSGFSLRHEPPSPVVAMIRYAILKYSLLFLQLEPERNQMVPEVRIL